MKLYEAKKLHYGEYLYRLSITNGLAGHFRTELQKEGKFSWIRKKLDEINACYNPKEHHVDVSWGYTNRFVDRIPIEQFFDAIDIYRILNKSDNYKIRCERMSLNIYTNDRELCKRIINTLRTKNIELYEPNPQHIDKLLTDSNIILTNKIPTYEYKITLGKRKGSPSLIKWIENSPSLAKIGSVAKDECLNEGWVKGYYFFVKDEKSLLIAQMLVGNNIQRIEKFVYCKE